MDPKSLFSLSDHLEGLSKEGDPLEVLQQTVDFEYFRTWLVEGLGYGDGAKGERPPFDPVMMFKALILQAQHNLSDARMEFMIRDRLSWLRFLGLSLGDRTPDENTIRHFRNRLTETGTLKRVMKALQRDPNDRYQSALELRRDLLAVARQFEGIPEELIKVVMQSVFEDRIELKRSILSDQHEAWSRDRMDSVVEVPMVPGHLTMTPSLEVPEEPSDPSADALAYTGVPTNGRGRSRSHSKLWLMLAGVVASGLATVLLGVMDNGSSPPPLANRAAMAAPVPEVAAPAAPAAPTPAEVAPAQVDLQISSEPGGLRVFARAHQLGG